jgi:hypothetical protein
MFKQGNAGGGRPKKSKSWKIAEDNIRDLMPGLFMMKISAIAKMESEDPTLGFQTVLAYVRKFPDKAVERFLPGTWADDVSEEKFDPEDIAFVKSLGKAVRNADQPNA